MALSLSDLQTFRDSLIRKRAAGVLSVKDQNGETVVYASLDAMGRAIADLEARIEEVQNGGRPTTIKFNSSKFGDCS